MWIFWRIRFLDRRDRQFKDRDLFLNTESLSIEVKAAVELAFESKSHATERELIKLRSLFSEAPDQQRSELFSKCLMGGKSLVLTDYFEDENGIELTLAEMGPILTGNPNVMYIPRGAEQHDIDFMLAERTPIPVAGVSLTRDEVQLLGYFARDLKELSNSAFMKENGPATLKSGGALGPSVETAVSDEEIRSFVTIFRRLYMDKEPANFLKTVAVFEKALGGHPYGKWVGGIGRSYAAKLKRPVDDQPFLQKSPTTFSRKRLIDVFLYTQYAHQPKGQLPKQYTDCLAEVGGHKSVLTWLFLTEIWKSSLDILNGGRQIVQWFEHYCAHHRVTPDVLPSVRHDNPGIGRQEKEAAKKERLFKQKADELAVAFWNQRGCPSGGPSQFLAEAEAALKREPVA